MTTMGRRAVLASAGAMLLARRLRADDPGPVYSQIERRHFEALDRLRRWVKQPTIAAENRGMAEGNALLLSLLREAGFQRAERVPTDGHPGAFATLDAGARKTAGLYFMYDVKQVKPEEWSSPPWEARLVDLPGLGKAVMGRGAVNQKGPQASFLAALHAIRGAGRKLPVNLVLVAEGEEEIGSPHFHQIVERPGIREALSRTVGVFMPSAAQGLDGDVSIALGAKGVVELELIADGEKWGRGPKKDIHSGNRARVDSPAFHLVQALATLVTKDGDPAIDGFADGARGLDPDQLAMIDETVRRTKEATQKEALGVARWAHDADFRQSLIDLCSRPTVNIQGLVGGYTGPGGMTILPHRAVAKMDLRLVPDMTRERAVAALKEHLARRGFADLEVHVTGGYDPTQTPARSGFVDAQKNAYSKSRVDAHLWPRTAGSYPGYLFTGDPLRLPAGHFGLGHGSRAHAPDEYYLVESTNPTIQGMDGAVRSFVDYLYELATV
jgi:acetylornithine deacetylase/succinyl-diaminopimelate desuccinylase-like protein